MNGPLNDDPDEDEAMDNDYWRGHAIAPRRDGAFVYLSDGVPVTEDPSRPCGHCHLPNRPDGHDACIGHLKDVTNACCGHGIPYHAYVQFADGGRLAEADALQYILVAHAKERAHAQLVMRQSATEDES